MKKSWRPSQVFQCLEKTAKSFPIIGKLAALGLAMWALAAPAAQHTLLSEGFNSASLPSGWTTNRLADPGGALSNVTVQPVTTAIRTNATPYEGTHFIRFNSYYCASGAEARLQSPPLALAGYTNLSVQYAWFHDPRADRPGDGMWLQWTTNNTTWETTGPFILRRDWPTGWTVKAWALPAQCAAATNLRVGFKFHSGYGNNCYLDEVNVCATDFIADYPYEENFESGFGAWANDGASDFGWARHTGLTASGEYPGQTTGVAGAHSGSYYLYMESSAPNFPGKTASLQAPFDFSGLAQPRLRFFYHLCGTHIGTNYVEASLDGASWSVVWSKAGPQQSAETSPWTNQSVNLEAYGGQPQVWLRFRGATGSGGLGDAALDSVAVSESFRLSHQFFFENAGANAIVGGLGSDDAGGGALVYALVAGDGDTGNAAFNISGTNLRANASFDYEVQNAYSIRVRATDEGGLSFEKQFTISIINTNEAPAGDDHAINLSENQAHIFAAGDFPFSDPDGGDSLGGIKLTGLETAGTLRYAGSDAALNQEIAVADLANLSFAPDFNGSGTPYATFEFQVRDAGGLYSAASYTMTVNVAADECSGMDAALCVGGTGPTNGAHVVAGAAYVKTWVISNHGHSAWASNTLYTFAFGRGTNLADTAEVPLNAGETIYPGGTRSFSVNLAAPVAGGAQRGFWTMRHNGTNFGERVWLDVVVDLPEIVITNNVTAVASSVGQIAVGGTAHATVTGLLRWTNSLTGQDGTFAAAPQWTIGGVNLAAGANVITVAGTNAAGVGGSDAFTVTRLSPPVVQILTADSTVPTGTTVLAINGTNSADVAGELYWTNSLGGQGSIPAAPAWQIPEIGLTVGTNVIAVSGTNTAGETAGDMVTLVRPPDYVNPDADGDGMPDEWETLHFPQGTAALPDQDDDTDGQNNLSEYIARTLPRDSQSVFKATAFLAPAGSAWVVAWASETDRVYAVRGGTNVQAGGATIAEGINATPPANVYTDTTPRAESPWYYRIEVAP